MIPLADDNPSRSTPYIVYGLIVANIIIYAIDRIHAMGPIGSLWNWSLVPEYLMFGHPVTKVFPVVYQGMARQMQVTYTGLNPRWLTVLTSMFMHGGLLHIGGNMLYLWIFGNNIEDALGHVKFFIFYLVCGVAAAMSHVLINVHSETPLVGASGAIAGVLGAYLYLFPRNTVRTLVFLGFFWTFVDIPAMIVLGAWFVIQLTNIAGSGGTLGGGVAYWAHVGGFVSGIIIILLLGGRKSLQRGRRYNHRPYTWE
ncbi:MAG: rhomboid family intramembrane serine protease [Armatimonadota bacterium]|nr:rhomboid family intramembrane serine protease [bacterium]